MCIGPTNIHVHRADQRVVTEVATWEAPISVCDSEMIESISPEAIFPVILLSVVLAVLSSDFVKSSPTLSADRAENGDIF